LASFAANFDQEGGVCVIFVEYLDATEKDSKSVIFGSMFFQSIYAQYTQAGKNSVTVQLFVNKNALSSTYIGKASNAAMANPFTVTSARLVPDKDTEMNGLPTFNATVAGITDTGAYFHLDFNADRSIAWQNNCTTSGFGNYAAGPCTGEPVNAQGTGFDGTPLPDITGSFDDAKFGGYVVSGTIYTSQLCFGEYNCKFVQMYSVDLVSANNWLFDVDGSYGVIGMGPGSYIWEGFIDPETKRATYSIELARVSFYTDDKLGASDDIQSNITFGAANDEHYQGNPSIYMPSLSNYSYGLEQFAFGIVYQDNGVDSSDYWYQLATNYPVEFSINFKGLGLPANLYSDFVTLFEFITSGSAVCDNTVDGICTLPGLCDDYSALNDYYFLFDFTQDVQGNYMRVPLATFAQPIKNSGGDPICNVEISYLDTNAPQSQNIILGGMFFQEFFGVFINDYNSWASGLVDQGARLYAGQNSQYQAYIGNEDLPDGTNPFVPHPPAPPPESGLGTAWIVVISIICAAVVAFLGYLLYRYKMATANKNVRGSNVVYGTDGKGGQVNASGTMEVPKDEEKLLNVEK